jgi:hypothetical protein
MNNDPAHWRRRAAKTREIAAQVRGADEKRAMASVADSYDLLAADAENRLTSRTNTA